MSVYQNSNSDAGNNFVVDLRSDTLSQPTDSMRQAMAAAIVGDDVYMEDPTIILLEERSAHLLGKEAGLFVPSGTMANLIAIMVHCKKRGGEAIAGSMSHTFLYEQGGPAQIAGVQISTVANNPDGTFSLEEMQRKIRGDDYHEPITSLIIVENTHNMCGGKALPMEWLDKLVVIANEHCIPLHMDGARLFNAATFLNIPPFSIVKGFDSVCFCLSKGLSSPVGSVLVGTKSFIKEARRMRKVLGGGIRQGGVLAAAGLVSLDEIVPTLKEDHSKAQTVAKAIVGMNSKVFHVDIANLQTNIMLLQIQQPEGKTPVMTSSVLNQRLAKVTSGEIAAGCVTDDGRGIVVKVSSRDWKFVRMVFYHQINDEHVKYAIKKITFVLNELDGIYS